MHTFSFIGIRCCPSMIWSNMVKENGEEIMLHLSFLPRINIDEKILMKFIEIQHLLNV